MHNGDNRESREGEKEIGLLIKREADGNHREIAWEKRKRERDSRICLSIFYISHLGKCGRPLLSFSL